MAQAVKRTISVGGDLKQWDGLPQYKVILSNGVPSVPVNNSGYYSLAYDDQNLYVLGVFDQPKDTVKAVLNTDAGEWWNDDVMELFIRTQPFVNAPVEAHFAVNPAGTRFKAYTATTDYKSVGRIEDNRWVLELAIPLNTATFPAVKAGDIWALKVGREHQKAAEFPIWPVGGDFNSPNNYGYLAFTEQPADASALATAVTEKLGKSPAGSPLASRLSDIGSYAVYYGNKAADVQKLLNYDLAIVQPSTVNAAQLKMLHDNGTRVVAYMTIGELDRNSAAAPTVDPSWILGENKNWGSKFIDASQPGWQKIVADQAAKLSAAGLRRLLPRHARHRRSLPQDRAGAGQDRAGPARRLPRRRDRAKPGLCAAQPDRAQHRRGDVRELFEQLQLRQEDLRQRQRRSQLRGGAVQARPQGAGPRLRAA